MNIAVEFDPLADEIERTAIRNSRRARPRQVLYSVAVLAAGIGLTVFGIWLPGLMLMAAGGAHIAVLTVLARSRLIEPTIERLCEPTVVHLDESGFAYRRTTAQGQQSWSSTRIVTGPDTFTFAVANRVAIIVPRRAFHDDDLTTFDAFIAGGSSRDLIRLT